MTKHERDKAMVAELDDKGFRPAEIAKVMRIPLDRVTDLLDEIDAIPTQVITTPTPKETPVLTVEIEWAEPPAAKPIGRHQSEALDAIVAELKKRPGQWAAVKRGMASPGGGAAFKKRGCETVSRRGQNSPEGGARYDVYARWPS